MMGWNKMAVGIIFIGHVHNYYASIWLDTCNYSEMFSLETRGQKLMMGNYYAKLITGQSCFLIYLTRTPVITQTFLSSEIAAKTITHHPCHPLPQWKSLNRPSPSTSPRPSVNLSLSTWTSPRCFMRNFPKSETPSPKSQVNLSTSRMAWLLCANMLTSASMLWRTRYFLT